MKIFRFAMLVSIFFAMFVSGQSQGKTQGGFPDATFEGNFTKFIPSDNVYHPFDAWRASVGLRATLVRLGRHSSEFFVIIDTIGTEKKSSRVNIAGAGYRFGANYVYTFSDDFSIAGGVDHLSSHITKDLVDKIAEERRKGVPIPTINSSDLNVLYVEFRKRFSDILFQPEFRLKLQPVGFRFRGGRYSYDQPVFLDNQATLWSGHEKRLVVETQHEFGKDSFNFYYLRMELYAKNQRQGRLQLSFGGSPGENFHTSPNVGQQRDGLSFSIGLNFYAK